MAILRITKEFRFEGAHALRGYDGKCKHIHGHSYLLYVTVEGTPLTRQGEHGSGMIIDFKIIKNIVNQTIIEKFDHALVMQEGTPLTKEIESAYGNVIVVPMRPTSENMICHFAQEITKALPPQAKLYSLKLYETAGSYVEWFADDK